MNNQEIAAKLALVADMLEIKGADPFEIRAYRNAARAVEFQTRQLRAVVESQGAQGLEKIAGIGQTISQNIAELIKTGQLTKLKKLIKGTSRVMVEMLGVPGLGPKTVKKLYQLLKPKTLADLKKKLKDPRNQAKLQKSSILEKSVAKFLQGIIIAKSASGRIPLIQALPLAEQVAREIDQLPDTQKVAYVGSLRRRQETVGDVDVICASKKPSQVIEKFVSLPLVEKKVSQGSNKSTIITPDKVQIDLEVLPQKEWGSLLIHFTGSKEFNIKMRAWAEKKGLSFSEHGFKRIKDGRVEPKISIYCSDEEAAFQALHMQYIPPELREGGDELKMAFEHNLPQLIELKDIQGDLQMHSDWSDGRAPILELAQAARDLKYQYIAISDHSAGLGITGGIGPKNVSRYFREIEQAEQKVRGLKILKAIEVNVRSDGSLDQPADFLKKFDLVLAGLHSSLSQPKEKATARLLKVLENPLVDILVHPTGRLIDQRPEITADWEAVFKKASQLKKVLEINSSPKRLDLKDSLAKRAQELDVKLVITTDAHSPDQLAFMQWGVFQARRAWLTKKDVLNTQSLAGLLKSFRV